jgi:broad specificity phosphatase PhoE
MTRSITLIRHAETEANASGGWQGQSDSELTARGLDQIDRLRGRFESPGLLVCSDLERAVVTAESIGAAELDPLWREYHFGAWDGLHPDEIQRRFPGELAAMRSGEDFAPDGGERASEFAVRIQQAFTSVVARLGDGEEAIVVTHGGVIHTLVATILGIEDRGALVLPANTSATTILLDGDRRPQVYTYNDATHLEEGANSNGGRSVVLYRHGETVANIEHRWHGRRETPLTETGRLQAADLAAQAPQLDLIASSPLSRARDTAASVASVQRREVAIIDDLAEIHFGEWEGLTADEAEAADPEAFERIYRSGFDEPRGATGETFGGAGARFGAAVDEITDNSGGGPIGLFTHGGVARAYVASVLGMPFADRDALPVLRNTAHAEVSLEPRRTRVVSYNVAPHLEG